jgi:hypothetical protein
VTQVITGNRRNFSPFVAIDRRFRRFDIAGSARLNFYKTKNFLLPCNQINLTLVARRAEVAVDDNVSQLAQMEVGHFFATLANVLMRRSLVWR